MAEATGASDEAMGDRERRLSVGAISPHNENSKQIVTVGGKEDAEVLWLIERFAREFEKVFQDEAKQIGSIMYETKKNIAIISRNRESTIQKIPHFWTTVLTNHPILRAMVTPEDIDVLQYLRTVHVDSIADLKHLSTSDYEQLVNIEFRFDQNLYFSNEKLDKLYGYYGGEWSITYTPIDWVEESSEQYLRSKRFQSPQSFFWWFIDPKDATTESSEDKVFKILTEEIFTNPVPFLKKDRSG